MLRLPQRRRQSGEFVDGQRLAAACRVDARRVEHFIGHHALECGMQRFATLAEGRVDQLERQLAQLGSRGPACDWTRVNPARAESTFGAGQNT